MKNFLLSLLIVAISFFCTLFILNSFSEKNIDTPTSESIATSIIEDEEVDESDQILVTEESSSNSIEESSDDSGFSQIVSSYSNWRNYQNKNIELSTDFIPLNDLGNEIGKKEFLEKLKTGEYIPVKRFEEEYMYQLYKLDENTDEKIGKSIKSISYVTYNYFLKEGKPFPEFDFKDINGNEFSTNNIRGKLLVIKCWFVQSKTCIQEFPKLNDLYDKYEAHEDIVFLSLAFDKPAKLKKFLAKKEFRYPVVANSKDFLQKKVQVKQYPTHVIIDQYGDILKMVSNVDALTLALDTTVNGSLLNDEAM